MRGNPVQADTGALRRQAGGQLPLLVRPGGGGSADIDDVPMAEGHEMIDRSGDTRGGVDEHARDIGHVAIYEHERAALRMAAEAVLRQAGRRQHETLDLGRELAEQDILPRGRFVGVAQEDGIAGFIRPCLGAPDKGRKERVGHVRHDQRDIPCTPGAERPRHLVGHVTQTLGRREHAPQSFLAQAIRLAERARNRCSRHPCCLCNLSDRGGAAETRRLRHEQPALRRPVYLIFEM